MNERGLAPAGGAHNVRDTIMDHAPRSSRMRPSILIPGIALVLGLLGLIAWVSLDGKPDATASDPQTKSAGTEGSVPARSAGGTSDPRMTTGTK